MGLAKSGIVVSLLQPINSTFFMPAYLLFNDNLLKTRFFFSSNI